MRRISGHLGSGNRKDVLAVVNESAASPSSNEGCPSIVAPKGGGNSPISPDEWGVLLAYRNANKTLSAAPHPVGSAVESGRSKDS